MFPFLTDSSTESWVRGRWTEELDVQLTKPSALTLNRTLNVFASALVLLCGSAEADERPVFNRVSRCKWSV